MRKQVTVVDVVLLTVIGVILAYAVWNAVRTNV